MTLPKRGVVFVLAVDVLAAFALVLAFVLYPTSATDLRHVGGIVLLGLASAELTRQVERKRRRFADTLHVNLSSVWIIAAAVTTSPGLAAATTTLLYSHLWLRSWRNLSGMHTYRAVFSASNAVLSCLAVWALARAVPTGGVLAMAGPMILVWGVLVIVTYSVINSGIVGVAIALLSGDRSARQLIGTWQENSIEYATLCMGVLAGALLLWQPYLLVLVLLPLYVLHRSVLIRQLEHAAATDEKTGLLNAASWHNLAAAELDRARRHDSTFGVLLVDIDHFKSVNDSHGHLTGDHVLRLVADAMRAEVRADDLCGRFGGEEFVVLLPDTKATDVVDVAERICRRVRALRIEDADTGELLPDLKLSVSIGAATYPDHGSQVDEVLMSADNAMFAAKDAGRDQVRAVRPSAG
ncbi:GGDEF domain-containing protein [Labedaea rhizosphaerae]|uniref:Diguanylate cyclase (GGDEF)-like protein n=1 Tax=Labedaea rhizosphaerae TaxID=598644 RepID=A0A4R6SDY2_LABRH|nr:GGDEF domain-containing protein [Labedaea rhizosphaerae]TDP97904.1 diguanylate cyclase (GGDEF)-like protein [Labedaea rhizosphaerae]